MKVLAKPNWQQFEVGLNRTHHLFSGEPAYEKRFLEVLPFHAPGIAPVKDHSGAYHIDPEGNPIYEKRYKRTFGYYHNKAAVVENEEWFHIDEKGNPLSKKRYAWCGNFQQNICTVKEQNGTYHHVNSTGERLYSENYCYAGDFREGAAVVLENSGLHYHINSRGEKIHPHGYDHLDVFHKNFARAKTFDGWFHINRNGKALYSQTYAQIEPFYNGVSRVETDLGAILLIDEKGSTLQTISPPKRDLFHEVSADIISYWSFFTLKAASDFQIFSYLPATTKELSERTGLQPGMCEKLLLGLQEMHYVKRKFFKWAPTEKGVFLLPTHEYSLADALTLWHDEHFTEWQKLSQYLQNPKPINWFTYLDEQPEKCALYHRAIATYAKRDYASICNRIDFSSTTTIADIGGAKGTLLTIIKEKHPQIETHLLDRYAVLKDIKEHKCHPLDFFQKWPEIKVDRAILSRILHDWPDEKALHLLKKSRKLLLNKESRLLVIENLFDKKTASGALLNLNMHVMTAGRERDYKEFQTLFSQADLECESIIALNEVSSVMILRPR